LLIQGDRRDDQTFRKISAEAVRIALTSGLPRKRVAADLGIGLSTLTRWVSLHRQDDLPASPDTDLARENERLRLENRVLREEREVLK
jgi:transposase